MGKIDIEGRFKGIADMERYLKRKEENKKNKVIIELNVEDLKNICDSKEANIIKCDGCKQNIEQLLKCNLYCAEFKIKEQIEESDMYKEAYCPQCKKYSICELKKQKNIVCCSLFKG